VLCDWELAVEVKKDGKFIVPRSHRGYQTVCPMIYNDTVFSVANVIQGTWDYMSFSLLGGSPTFHHLGDDLESFLWIVVELATFHLHYKHPRSLICQDHIEALLRERKWFPRLNRVVGGDTKEAVLLDTGDRRGWRTLEFPGNKAVQTLLQTLFECATPEEREATAFRYILKTWVQVESEPPQDEYHKTRSTLDEYAVARQKHFAEAFEVAILSSAEGDWKAKFPKDEVQKDEVQKDEVPEREQRGRDRERSQLGSKGQTGGAGGKNKGKSSSSSRDRSKKKEQGK